MKKKCPRCGNEFECVHSLDCWCVKVNIDSETRLKLKQYNDCLCKECLETLVKQD